MPPFAGCRRKGGLEPQDVSWAGIDADSPYRHRGATRDVEKTAIHQVAELVLVAMAVLNAGIGGNRTLRDIVGLSGLSRLDRDALSVGLDGFPFPGFWTAMADAIDLKLFRRDDD